MIKVSAINARTCFSALLGKVMGGEGILIPKCGKGIVRRVPAEQTN